MEDSGTLSGDTVGAERQPCGHTGSDSDAIRVCQELPPPLPRFLPAEPQTTLCNLIIINYLILMTDLKR